MLVNRTHARAASLGWSPRSYKGDNYKPEAPTNTLQLGQEAGPSRRAFAAGRVQVNEGSAEPPLSSAQSTFHILGTELSAITRSPIKSSGLD